MNIGKVVRKKQERWDFPEEDKKVKIPYVPATVQPSRRHEMVRKIIQDVPPISEPEPVEVEHV